MAIPPGLVGVVLILLVTGSTLNIMSLMGVIMMAGIVVSNSILIVEFAGILHKQGKPLLEATVEACRVRLRPILMTSLATLLGMIPLALGLEAGSEQYAPLARAIIGGLALSVVVTVFLVPAVYLVIHGRGGGSAPAAEGMNMSKQSANLHIRPQLCAASCRRRSEFCPVAAAAQQQPLPDAPPTQLIAALAQDSSLASQLRPPAAQTRKRRTKHTARNAARGSAAHHCAGRADGHPQQPQHQRRAPARARPGPGHTRSALGRDAHGFRRPDGGRRARRTAASPRGLNNPSVYNRAAGGLTVSQLITDFGRTHNLVLSAQSTAKAQLESERATELDITLAVDQAFYQALTAQAVLKVAQQTVAQRQATGDQVGALTKAKIKSDLDLSFADVQLSQAKLLLLDAENNDAVCHGRLNNVLGSEQDQQYSLVDETNGNPPPAPDDPEALVQRRFTARPDLAALNDSFLAARAVQHCRARSVDADRLRNGRRRRHARARATRSCPPGTAPPEPTSAFQSSMAFSTTPRRRKPNCARRPHRNTSAICAT